MAITTKHFFARNGMFSQSGSHMKHKQAILKARALYYGKHRNKAIAASRAWNAKNAKSSLRRARKRY